MSYSPQLITALLDTIAQRRWVGLLDGTGTELANADYSRLQLDVVGGTSPTWAPPLVGADQGRVENGDVLAWPEATVDWDPVAEVAVFDAATGGNLLARQPLRAPKQIFAGERFRIPPQGLKMRMRSQ